MKRVIALLVCFISQCVHAQFSLSYEALVRKGLPVDTVVINENETLVIANDDRGAFLIIIENKSKTTFWQMSIDGSMVGVHSFDDSTDHYALDFRIAHIDSARCAISISQDIYKINIDDSVNQFRYYFDRDGLVSKSIKVMQYCQKD